MVDPLEVAGPTGGEPPAYLGVQGVTGEASEEEPSYPSTGMAEEAPGLDAPPPAPGY